MTQRALVVDDEEGIRVLCRVNLELGGFEVVEAADGVEAVEQAKSAKPDVIFLDLMMPKMDGWETLAALRADPDTEAIPVVLLTARSSEDDQLRGWGEGIFDYIRKPFTPTVLVERATAAIEEADPEALADRARRAIEQLRIAQDMQRRLR